MARALVTGASGFIGRALCRLLLARGQEVFALCRRPAPDLPPGVEPVGCDLRDGSALCEALERVAAAHIFHLAGHTSATRELAAVPVTCEANLVPTVNLLTAVAAVGCARLVLAGSMEEAEPPAVPSSPYAASKMASTLYARMFHRLYGTPVVHARVFMAYGPGQGDETKVVPHSFLQLLRGEELRLTSGTRRLDWIYVDDVAQGLVRLAEGQGLEGLTIDLGTGILTPLREVVAAIVALVDPAATPRFGSRPDRPGEQEACADTARTFALTGWRATTPLAVGLPRTARAFAARARPRPPVPAAPLFP